MINRYEKLKSKFILLNKKYKQKSDKIREIEFDYAKTIKENEKLKIMYSKKK
jgi:hypothetical protein